VRKFKVEYHLGRNVNVGIEGVERYYFEVEAKYIERLEAEYLKDAIAMAESNAKNLRIDGKHVRVAKIEEMVK